MARPFQSRRTSGVHELVDPDVPFPGGRDDQVTIELPCIRIFEETEGNAWTDICLSLRGGEQMALVRTSISCIFCYSIPHYASQD